MPQSEVSRIEVTVSPAGEVRIETRGFQGTACRNADAFLRSALGLVRSDQPTAEAYAVPVSAPTLFEGPPG
jgi:hypothetical protein